MRISLSESCLNGFKKWSDAHPAKPDPLHGNGQNLDYTMTIPVDESRLTRLVVEADHS